MKSPSVSIIFPIYNNESYLERCVRSVMGQTIQNIELILIDDGSTDSAPRICDRLAEKDSRIRVVHKKNEGSAAGRNLGIELAQGEYIAFVESDDYVEPYMYEKLYDCAKKTDTDIVKCGFNYNENGILHEIKFFYNVAGEGEVFEAKEKPRIFLYHASIWASIYRRQFVIDNGLRFIETPSATYSDFSWMAMTYAHARRITILHSALYNYTYDNPGSSRVQQGEKTYYKIFHCGEANRILREAGIFEDVKEEIIYHEYRTCLGHFQRIKSSLRNEYYLRFRKMIIDASIGGIVYSRFPIWDRMVIMALLKNNRFMFYSGAHLEAWLRDLLSSNRATNRLIWIFRPLRRGGKRIR